jgi:hypothetical protein
MRTFLCEVDPTGLRRLTPEELIPRDDLSHPARDSSRSASTLFWTLLAEDDAEDLRADVEAGRHAEACGTLLNRAVEIISLGAALGTTRAAG